MKLSVTGSEVKVSPTDWQWASSRRWHISDNGYIRCYSGNPGGTPLRMHRLVMERALGRKLKPSELIDHINGDKTDNRRSNLRLATKSQNGMNLKPRAHCTSRFIGVGYDVTRSRWMSYVNADGKRWYLGRYETEVEAAWMRDQWALALHDEFASLNFHYVPVHNLKRF